MTKPMFMNKTLDKLPAILSEMPQKERNQTIPNTKHSARHKIAQPGERNDKSLSDFQPNIQIKKQTVELS